MRAYGGAVLALSTRVHAPRMTDQDKKREERLAAALRENLRRRKAQSRKLDAGDEKKGKN